MASQQALTRQQTQSIGAVRSATAQIFDAFPEDKYIVLAPRTHMAELPPGMRLSVTEVSINPDPDSREVFPIAGGSLLIGKPKLDAIAAAAGISWTQERRIDGGRHPHYVEMEVKGRMVDFDGTVRELTGHKVIDLRQDVGGVAGKDYAEIVHKAKTARKPRDPGPQLMEARKFIAEIAVSKAKNRAIASALAFKRSYTRAELRKPFIIPKLTLDASDERSRRAIEAQMVGATAALYGGAPQVIDATFDTPDPAYSPGEPDGEASGATPPVPEANTGVPEVLAAIREAWSADKAGGMTAEVFRQLCGAATGKHRKEDMTVEDASAVVAAVEAYLANQSAAAEDEDDGLPV